MDMEREADRKCGQGSRRRGMPCASWFSSFLRARVKAVRCVGWSAWSASRDPHGLGDGIYLLCGVECGVRGPVVSDRVL